MATNFEATLDSIQQATKPRKPRPVKVEIPKESIEERYQKASYRTRGKIFAEYIESREAELEPETYKYGMEWSRSSYLDYDFGTLVVYINQSNAQQKKQRLELEDAEKKYGKDYKVSSDELVEYLQGTGGGGLAGRILQSLSKASTEYSLCSCCGLQSRKGGGGAYERKQFAVWAKNEKELSLPKSEDEVPYEGLLVEDPEGKCDLSLYWKDK